MDADWAGNVDDLNSGCRHIPNGKVIAINSTLSKLPWQEVTVWGLGYRFFPLSFFLKLSSFSYEEI